MGNGYTGGNSLLAMLNCSVECARKLENEKSENELIKTKEKKNE
jgi:hypothetical protein